MLESGEIVIDHSLYDTLGWRPPKLLSKILKKKKKEQLLIAQTCRKYFYACNLIQFCQQPYEIGINR